MKYSILKTRFNILVISVLPLLFSCNSSSIKEIENKKDLIKSSETIMELDDETKFPNKKSELALYMRNLYNDLKANKKQIKNSNEGLNIEWALKYANLKTAKPTDSKDAGPVFEAFADKFLMDLKAFDETKEDQGYKIYNGMIQSCLDCHSEYCMGPMASIRKLRL